MCVHVQFLKMCTVSSTVVKKITQTEETRVVTLVLKQLRNAQI